MGDDLTTPPDETPLSLRLSEEEHVPALVIVWSADEPERVGEVAFFPELEVTTTVGRSPEGAAFFRQRPGVLERRPVIAASGISREQLRVTRRASGLDVERKGQPAMRVNGAVSERAIVRPGNTIEIERRMLLLCTERAARMPALRHARIEMAFGDADPSGILGESPAAWRLRDDLAYAAEAAGHVLVTGESGTGKELAARAIHARSGRGPLVAHSAATFPAGLIDAELFGNAKNYPNAGMPERGGLVGEAHGGVLFLDEIGELPADLHARLLLGALKQICSRG